MVDFSKRLYKDKTKGKLFGVCAGLADYLNISAEFVRVALIVGLFVFPLTWLIYPALALILDDKSIVGRDSVPPKPTPQQDWRFTDLRNQSSSVLSMQDVPQALIEAEQTLQRLEERVMNIESFVTSETFEFQAKLWPK